MVEIEWNRRQKKTESDLNVGWVGDLTRNFWFTNLIPIFFPTQVGFCPTCQQCEKTEKGKGDSMKQGIKGRVCEKTNARGEQ